MIKIVPNAFYSIEELKELLHRKAKISLLRRYGLVGIPGIGFYWGGNVIDAITRLWKHRARKRLQSEDDDNGRKVDKPIPAKKIHPIRRESGKMESVRERLIREEEKIAAERLNRR